MKWLEVRVETTPENEDFVSDILYAVGAEGLTIEDPQDIIEMTGEEYEKDWDFIDESLLTNLNPDELVIKAYYSEANDLESIKDYILERIEEIPYMQLGKRYGKVEFNEVDEKDWAESWKQYYKPTRIGKNIVIKPTWEDYEAKEDDVLIELDPGMAFGTGTHETTRMCSEALETYMEADSLVYDIGTGSGILGIIAAKLGAKEVIGVDLDPTCIEVSKENIALNNVEDKVTPLVGDLLDVVDDKADLIVSNIIAEIIVRMTGDLRDYLKMDGIFIASGIIVDKVEMVEEALTEQGFHILEVKKMKDWACIIARK